MKFKPGVVWGDDLKALFNDAKENGYAIPAVNVTSNSTANAVLEAARLVNSPVIIQLSHGGSEFFAGRSLDNIKHQASIIGACSGAFHVHNLAEHYEVPVVLHTDHANKDRLPWVYGVLAESKRCFERNGYPLFSSHMIDLSAESLEFNITESAKFLEQAKAMNVFLEMEIGVTGGEEDTISNQAPNSKLYSKPEDVYSAYSRLSEISQNILIAAAFGNLHGTFAEGVEHLKPEILGEIQKFVQEQVKSSSSKPVNLVMHGGSGSEVEDIKKAITFGVVKVNIDTDMQWEYWDGVHKYYKTNESYLQSAVGNEKNLKEPNKKYFDPRAWLREGERSMVANLKEKFELLGCVGRNGL